MTHIKPNTLYVTLDGKPRRIAEWNVVDHGVHHEEYFQGHGIAYTDYTHTATGCGSNPQEALDDALEELTCLFYAMNVEGLERDIRKEHPDFNDPAKVQAASVSAYHQRHNPSGADPDLCSDECDDCGHHHYLSIDLRIETA